VVPITNVLYTFLSMKELTSQGTIVLFSTVKHILVLYIWCMFFINNVVIVRAILNSYSREKPAMVVFRGVQGDLKA